MVDVALGDLNDDGRYEIMLAIWREDTDGHERSQPCMVGHRGGHYDLLWGGWTFTHIWRSEYGFYSSLLLTDEQRPLISVMRSRP